MQLYSVLLNIDHLIGIMQTRCLKEFPERILP